MKFSKFGILCRAETPYRSVLGSVDDFRIYERVVSSDEINTMMSRVAELNTPSTPAFHVTFDTETIENIGSVSTTI